MRESNPELAHYLLLDNSAPEADIEIPKITPYIDKLFGKKLYFSITEFMPAVLLMVVFIYQQKNVSLSSAHHTQFTTHCTVHTTTHYSLLHTISTHYYTLHTTTHYSLTTTNYYPLHTTHYSLLNITHYIHYSLYWAESREYNLQIV